MEDSSQETAGTVVDPPGVRTVVFDAIRKTRKGSAGWSSGRHPFVRLIPHYVCAPCFAYVTTAESLESSQGCTESPARLNDRGTAS
jgi:hypothetical protein